MFGGWTGIKSDDLFVVEFSRLSVVSLQFITGYAVHVLSSIAP